MTTPGSGWARAAGEQTTTRPGAGWSLPSSDATQSASSKATVDRSGSSPESWDEACGPCLVGAVGMTEPVSPAMAPPRLRPGPLRSPPRARWRSGLSCRGRGGARPCPARPRARAGPPRAEPSTRRSGRPERSPQDPRRIVLRVALRARAPDWPPPASWPAVGVCPRTPARQRHTAHAPRGTPPGRQRPDHRRQRVARL
jgi:hypothetical protein